MEVMFNVPHFSYLICRLNNYRQLDKLNKVKGYSVILTTPDCQPCLPRWTFL